MFADLCSLCSYSVVPLGASCPLLDARNRHFCKRLRVQPQNVGFLPRLCRPSRHKKIKKSFCGQIMLLWMTQSCAFFLLVSSNLPLASMPRECVRVLGGQGVLVYCTSPYLLGHTGKFRLLAFVGLEPLQRHHEVQFDARFISYFFSLSTSVTSD